jgi:SagB-type dehydrogenase family enzyme
MHKKKDRDRGGDPGIGRMFQNQTKYTPEKLGGHTLDWGSMPEPYKEYAGSLALVPLPKPEFSVKEDLWTLLNRRRSRREYIMSRVLKLGALSTLLWATQGFTARYGDTYFRTAPSAGGLYPVETYLNVRAVESVPPGIYHFRPQNFDLELLKEGNHAPDLTEAALHQAIARSAQVTFIWSAILARSKWKYRERAYRYIYLDAGHIAQNLYLAGEALGLGVCGVGAFFDDQVNGIVGLDGVEETAVYLATVGIREVSEREEG